MSIGRRMTADINQGWTNKEAAVTYFRYHTQYLDEDTQEYPRIISPWPPLERKFEPETSRLRKKINQISRGVDSMCRHLRVRRNEWLRTDHCVICYEMKVEGVVLFVVSKTDNVPRNSRNGCRHTWQYILSLISNHVFLKGKPSVL